MRMKYKTKSIVRKIAFILAGIAALGLLAFGIKAIVDYTKNDLKKITPAFEVGNLGADGKYVNDESTLYTKEAFGCYGLQVKPDFDSTVNYQIFYYDILDNYISSTEVLSEGYGGVAPVNGAYARLVIEPREDEDGKISLTERVKYPMQLTVKVKKNQDINNRFINFKGRCMEVVNDTDSLVFTNNMSFDETTLTFVDSDRYCVTSSVVLKVNGGSTFNYDSSLLNEDYVNSTPYFYEFKDLPLEDNYLTYGHATGGTYSLDKKTKYIIIVVDAGNTTGKEWTETEVKKLPLCFSVTKTK